MKKVTLLILISLTSIFILFFIAVLFKSADSIYDYLGHKIAVSKASDAIKEAAEEKTVFIDSVPSKSADTIIFQDKEYKMYCQYSREYEGYNDYLAAHGCTVTTLTSVLRAYVPECSEWTPYETITIAEKALAGEEKFDKNYSKRPDTQMPFTFLATTQILDKYGISNEYEPYFSSDDEVKEDILEHLYKGKQIIFVISQLNRETGEKTNKWTLSYHTMLMIGADENGNVLIGNPAGSQRFELVSLDEMIDYMWSCTNEPDSFYWNGKPKCGGYIKIME